MPASTRQETVGLLAWTLRIMGRAHEALPLLNEAVAATREQTNYSLHTQLLIERARVHMALGDDPAAEADYKGALILIEGIRGTIHASEDRIKYWSKVDSSNVNEELVALLWEKNGRTTDAFEVVERAKGRVFLELLGETAGLYPKDDDLEIMSKLALTEYDLKNAPARRHF